MAKIVLGFSGGVDSAVCAVLLMRQGHEVYGLYLDNTDENAKKDAISAADTIGIPLKIIDVHDSLEKIVCSRFTEAYLRGETPNPCILCNPTVKFKSLLDYANEIGAEHIATGHYAKAKNGCLFMGRPSNDQSYMLCRLTREQVSRLVLPLGDFEKTEVRAMAEDFGLPVAKKPDSMEICFIPDKDYIGWLGTRTSLPDSGDLLLDGKVIGRHNGIYRYTVGQRIPGLFHERKVYVTAIDAESNTVQLALWEDLFKTEVTARDFNALCDLPDGEFRARVRVRHTKWETPDCTVRIENGTAHILCDTPVRAPARGQSAVLYDGEKLLGGGFIE